VKSAEKDLKSWQKALLYLAAWLIIVVGFELLADVVLGSLLFHVAYVMLILPAANLAIPFIYTRKYGIKPWLILYMAAAAVILYFGFGYDSLSPNFLLSSLLIGFFGFGIGNILKDEVSAAVQEDIDSERKKKRIAEEKSYVSLLDSDPKTGSKANIRKKRKKKERF
jgi:hypothetical protein